MFNCSLCSRSIHRCGGEVTLARTPKPPWRSVSKPDAFREFHARSPAGGTPEQPALRQSQRDCVLQPRVARHELPWVRSQRRINPNGVASRSRPRAATPLGLGSAGSYSQGSSCLATPGFAPESLWDSPGDFPKGITVSLDFPGVGLNFIAVSHNPSLLGLFPLPIGQDCLSSSREMIRRQHNLCRSQTNGGI